MAQKISDINWNWIESHLGEDPIKLRLKKDAAEHLLEIVQIECRKKAYKKLSTTLKYNPRFIFGNTLSSEQSTSDMLALYHASLIPEGSCVCDLTSGLGIDVLHLAQSASSVTAIELQTVLCEALDINAKADPSVSDKIRVICGDCREVLKEICVKSDQTFEKSFNGKEEKHSGIGEDDGSNKNRIKGGVESTCKHHQNQTTFTSGKPFDVIFLDPARRSSTGKRLFSLHDCQPDVIEMIPFIRQACDTLIIKMSPMLDITQVCRELPCVLKIIVLGTNRECKELIAVCRWDKPEDEEVEISVVSLSSVKKEDLTENKSLDGQDDNGTKEDLPQSLSVPNDIFPNDIKGASTEYLLSGIDNIEVNKFGFYPSEESSVSGLSYVDSKFIEQWKEVLDKNLLHDQKGESESKVKNTKEEGTENAQEYKGREIENRSECSLSSDDKPYGERSGTGLSDSHSEFLYLYEPSPSMMKAGAFQLLAERFGLKKVRINSHLYLSEVLKGYFPGTAFKVRRIYHLTSSSIKALAKQNLKGEVAVRNYPMEAEILRKKLKIGNGVGYRYIATTTSDGLAFLFELTSVK